MKLPVSHVSCMQMASNSFSFIMLINPSIFVMSFKPLTFCERRLRGMNFLMGMFRVCDLGFFGGGVGGVQGGECWGGVVK